MSIDALLDWAKSRALPVHSCVTARISPAHLLGKASPDELTALVIVLAEAADPVKLKAVTEASDDGQPDYAERVEALRTAHNQARTLRTNGMTVPEHLARLDREYEAAKQRVRRSRMAA